jgi:histone acetyltransferase (RNA polymerase elongator complex component)
MNEKELTGQELMQIALDELIADPLAKINQNQVATKAGVSHSNLRKATYKDIKDNIILAQRIREQELLDLSYQQEITKLKVELEEAKGKIAKLKNKSSEPTLKEKKAAEGKVLTRLVEMYRFNDLLRSELRDKFHTDIIEETGEVLNVEFGQRQ